MDNFKLNYVAEGEGETILFIHGLSDNLLYWEVLANILKNDYRVIRVDLRGHGETPLGSDEITINVYSRDLKNLLDELGIDKVNLIGFSLGGAVALDFAIKYCETVSSLVVMSSFSKCDEYLKKTFTEFKTSLSGGFEEFYDYMIPKVLCPEVIENNLKELEMLKQISSKTANVEAYIKATDACLNFNVDCELSRIDVPALILSGRYDEICPTRYQENLENKIKNSKLIVLDNVKHNLLVGKNNSVISKFLNDFIKNKNVK